jgi:hypothetical protein
MTRQMTTDAAMAERSGIVFARAVGVPGSVYRTAQPEPVMMLHSQHA